MKLQILVPQYDETEDIIKPLLDSIKIQQTIDFNEIGVIICNDGSDVHLSSDFLNSYPFEILYYLEPHRGVSGTRNACLDKASADYVMFCDADDMFASVCALWVIFTEININHFDTLITNFIEETKAADTDEKIFINHEIDSTFVHGKVHRLGYLKDFNIRWNDSLTIHEDSFFNVLCQSCTDKVLYCPSPLYLWKWRDNSVCRHDDKYILKTYNNLIDSNDALIDEFTKRSMMDKVLFYVGFMVFDAYYTMNKPEWINQENKVYRNKTELRFKDYFLKREDLWNQLPFDQKMQLSNGIRSRAITEGMMMEAVTIEEWLKKVKKM